MTVSQSTNCLDACKQSARALAIDSPCTGIASTNRPTAPLRGISATTASMDASGLIVTSYQRSAPVSW